MDISYYFLLLQGEDLESNSVSDMTILERQHCAIEPDEHDHSQTSQKTSHHIVDRSVIDLLCRYVLIRIQ